MMRDEQMQKVKTFADAIGATIETIGHGDRSTWFCVNRKEWIDEIKANPTKYPNINPFEHYARKHFNAYFAREVRKNDPDKKIGKIEAYAKVFQWILNNHQKGLLMLGDCGTGKTAIMNALFNLFADGHAMWFNNEREVLVAEKKVFAKYSATDLMNTDTLDRALNYRFVMIDDIGTESETSITYGQRRNPVAELIDNAEKKNCLLILTSNLNGEQLLQKYGERTIDRLNHLTTVIPFVGDSFRS